MENAQLNLKRIKKMTTEKLLNKLAWIADNHREDYYIEGDKFILMTHYYNNAKDRHFSEEQEIKSIPQFLEVLGYYEDGYEDDYSDLA